MAHKGLLLNFKKPSPKSIEYKVLDDKASYGKIVAYPFERGYATTIANSLRRVMLSVLPGYAITGMSVKFHDETGNLKMLYSAFDNIHGVYEDTMEIIQNLKKVRLALIDSSDEKKILLEFKGDKTITAKDLAIENAIHIYNPELLIAKANKEANFTMELTISFGRGYIPGEQIQLGNTEVGFIGIDSVFSPINRVVYEVENYRIDQKTDYEQFIIEIWTDGSISVGDAVADSAKILKEHFSAFINFNEEEYDLREGQSLELDDSPEEEKLLKAMKTPIDELELNARAFNCLISIGINYVGDVLLRPKDELERTKNLGQKSLEEIKQKLHKLDLHLEMTMSPAITEKFLAFKATANEEMED